MYIGPWQEFKLAKILQLKDKIEKEAEQDNQLDPAKPKAQSTNARLQGNPYQDAGSPLALQQPHAAARAQSKQNLRKPPK